MKSSKRLLVILVCVMLICVAACVAVTVMNKAAEEDTSDTADTKTVIKSTDTANITAFSLSGTTGENRFSLSDNGWVYNSLSDFPLNTDFTDTTLESLSRISVMQIVEQNAADYSKYGLDKPQMTVSISEKDGTETKFLIGDYNSFSGYYYFTEEGSGDVCLTDATLPDLCSKEEKDFIKLDTLPDKMTADNLTGVYAEKAGSKYEINKDDDGFDTVKTAFASFSLTDYAAYKLTDENKALYGLDSPTALTVKYAVSTSSTDTSTSTVTTVQNYDYRVNVGTDDGKYIYFTVEDSDIVYRVESGKISALYQKS